MKPARHPLHVKVFSLPTLVMAAVLLALTIVEYLYAPHYRPVFPWHHVPGYMGLIGLGGCLVVVAAAKGLGRLLQRPEEDHDRD